MKLSGDPQAGTRLGKEEPKHVIASVLRGNIKCHCGDPGSAADWASDTADAIVAALQLKRPISGQDAPFD